MTFCEEVQKYNDFADVTYVCMVPERETGSIEMNEGTEQEKETMK